MFLNFLFIIFLVNWTCFKLRIDVPLFSYINHFFHFNIVKFVKFWCVGVKLFPSILCIGNLVCRCRRNLKVYEVENK